MKFFLRLRLLFFLFSENLAPISKTEAEDSSFTEDQVNQVSNSEVSFSLVSNSEVSFNLVSNSEVSSIWLVTNFLNYNLWEK